VSQNKSVTHHLHYAYDSAAVMVSLYDYVSLNRACKLVHVCHVVIVYITSFYGGRAIVWV